jgi:hypothetical protein
MSADPDKLLQIGEDTARRYEGVVTAYICGSLIEGFGNTRSDLDVFVLTDGPARLVGEHEEIRRPVDDEYEVAIGYESGICVDTECWIFEAVRKIAMSLNTCPLDDWTAPAALTPSYFQLAHGIRIGRPVTAAGVFAELRDSFDWEHLSRLLYCRFALSYTGTAEDAAGAVLAGDAGAALLSSRFALADAADALLAALGSTNIKPKWRFAKMRQLDLGELADQYLAAELDPDPSPAALLAAAKQRLRFAADLTVRAADAVGWLDRPQSAAQENP